MGAPTFCPSGFIIEKDAQACALPQCTDGKTRASDGVHCCWPGQAWSSREQCIGTPSCPAAMEPDGDTCRSNDLDNDGTPNAVDKCPTVAEDKDGFEDEDGCPDPDNDKDGVLDAQDRCPLEPEDKNNFQDDDGCPDEPERAARAAAQERVEAARREQAEREKRVADEQAARKQREEEQQAREGRRTVGWWLVGTGAVATAGGIAFFLAAESAQSSIQNGGLATGSDISSAVNRMQAFGPIGGAFIVLGAATAITGGILELTALKRPDEQAPAPPARAFQPQFRYGRIVW